MPTDIPISADRVMDVRSIPCSVKHGQIVRTFSELPVGEHFILLNDHDPVRLQQQFAAQWPGTFTWQYLAQGQDEFRVKITKLKPLGEPLTPVATSCGEH